MSYVKNNLKTNDVITEKALANFDDGISSVDTAVSDLSTRVTGTENAIKNSKQIKIPEMRLTGDKSKITSGEKTVAGVVFNDGNQLVQGFVKIKTSGDSSSWMNKKAFKFDVYKDEACTIPYNFKAKSSWNSTNGYNVKADYIDFTHARNLSCAKLAYEISLQTPAVAGFNKGFNTNSKMFINPNVDRQNLIYGIGWDVLAKNGKATISFTLRDFGNDNIDFTLEVDKGGAGVVTVGSFKTVQYETTHFTCTFDVPKDWTKAEQNIYIKGNFPSGIDLTDFMIIPGSHDVSFASSVAPWYNAPALGQVQGFPVVVYINDEYYGLETFCQNGTPALYGVPDDYSQGHAVFVKSMDDDARFKAVNSRLDDDSKFGLVFPSTGITDKMKDDWDEFRHFIVDSSDTVFKNEITNHLHLHQAIDIMLFVQLLNIRDTATKSMTWVTYSGGYYIPVLYDLDQSLGQSWAPWSGENLTKRNGAFVGNGIQNLGIQYDEFAELPSDNNVFARIAKVFPELVEERYAILRKTVLSVTNITRVFKEFIDSIPSAVYQKDAEVWADIPNRETNDFSRLQRELIKRVRYIDTQHKYKG